MIDSCIDGCRKQYRYSCTYDKHLEHYRFTVLINHNYWNHNNSLVVSGLALLFKARQELFSEGMQVFKCQENHKRQSCHDSFLLQHCLQSLFRQETNAARSCGTSSLTKLHILVFENTGIRIYFSTLIFCWNKVTNHKHDSAVHRYNSSSQIYYQIIFREGI